MYAPSPALELIFCHFQSMIEANSGATEIPSYCLGTKLITKENIQSEIIDKQVYSREEVYRNIHWLYE